MSLPEYELRRVAIKEKSFQSVRKGLQKGLQKGLKCLQSPTATTAASEDLNSIQFALIGI
jgi:hypothetical protein